MNRKKPSDKPAGTLKIGNKTFTIVLEPARSKPGKPAATVATQDPFPTTFQLMLGELKQVKRTDKPEKNRLGKTKTRFMVRQTQLEGSFTHFIEVAALALLEARGPHDQIDLYAAMTNLLPSSGFVGGKRKIKFEMKQLKATMDRLVRDQHVTEVGVTYTFHHYPHYRTLSVVIG